MSVYSTAGCAYIFDCEGVSYCVGPLSSMVPDCIRIDKNPVTCSYIGKNDNFQACIVSGDVFERRVFTYERAWPVCYAWYTYNCEFYPIIAVL